MALPRWFDDTFKVSVTLKGIDGALEVIGGAVLVYRERPGAPRTLLGSFPLAADGSFTASDPTASPVASAYRAVYSADGTPYAALVGSS